MRAMTYTSDEWINGDHADKQAVVSWVNTLDLPSGHVINLLHGDVGVIVEYGWDELRSDGQLYPCRDLHTCTTDAPPPAEFYRCSRAITPAAVDVEPDVLAEMGGAWRALSWQMVLEAGRRVRAWWAS